jgi:hypothetical protein
VATPADAVYELQVLDITGERAWLGWLSLVLVPLGLDEPLIEQALELRIVDKATGAMVAQRRVGGLEAGQTKQLIEAGLREMDAETFAAEWGLHSDNTRRTGDE